MSASAVFVPVTGDLTQDRSDIIVIPVNAVGVMGKGLAWTFAQQHPGEVARYRNLCSSGQLKAGGCHVLLLPDGIHRWAALATKNHWRDNSRLEWVASGLDSLAAQSVGKTVAVPRLGCGLGRLDWRDVEPLIRQKLTRCARVYLYGG